MDHQYKVIGISSIGHMGMKVYEINGKFSRINANFLPYPAYSNYPAGVLPSNFARVFGVKTEIMGLSWQWKSFRRFVQLFRHNTSTGQTDRNRILISCWQHADA